MSFEADQGRVEDRGKYVVVWRKQDGAWRIDVDIINSDLAAPLVVRAGKKMVA